MSLYEGDMQSRIMAGEKLEDVLKKPYSKNVDLSREEVLAIALNDYRASLPKPDNDAPKTDWAELGKNVLNNSSGIPIAVKPTTDAVKQQNAIILQNVDVLTQEDKFYEKLGIKYHNTHMFGVDSRLKGRLLVAVVLVGGYFAYKKFKK